MNADPISLVITPRSRDLGGFSVRRALPDGRRRTVGPFIFFDHMGPADFAPGHGIDVRPHPHIALATVTFLFEGEILHRDSLGSVQPIRPGDVNWMLAGRGIVHSERTREEVRRSGSRLHGIQSWVALPRAAEDTAPAFVHHPAATLPRIQTAGVDVRVVAGTAYGHESPVGVLSPTLYVAATMEAGATLEVDPDHPERAAYVMEGTIAIGDRTFPAGTMVVLNPGAVDAARGGAGAPGDRRRRPAGRPAPHLVELRRQLGRTDGAGQPRLARPQRSAFPEGPRRRARVHPAARPAAAAVPPRERRRYLQSMKTVFAGAFGGVVPLRRGGAGPDGGRRRAAAPAQATATGPATGASAGNSTGSSSGTASFYLSSPATTPAGSTATTAGSSTGSTDILVATGTAPAQGTSTASSAAATTASSVSSTGGAARAGVSAIGESLSPGGTAVTTPASTLTPNENGAAVGGAVGTAPAATPSYPSLLD